MLFASISFLVLLVMFLPYEIAFASFDATKEI